MTGTVRYHLRIREPHRHLVQVRVELPARADGRHRLLLPVWSPGSYLVREYARHVQGLAARDRAGRPLPATKTGKASWVVTGSARSVVVEYEVYAFERSVRTSHVSAEHAFLHGPSLLVYEPDRRHLPCEVAVAVPRDFAVACALPRRQGRFQARDYDELVDSPIECGRFEELRFAVRGARFRAVFCGRGREQGVALAPDLQRIAGAARDLFGPFPFRSYLAIVNLVPSGRGGLEHRASMALEWPRLRLTGEADRIDFLSLFAHELVHAWNVKAAMPRPFAPYDYQREAPTTLLWWFEGVTDYYAELLLRRAGILGARRFLERMVERHERLLDVPGRRLMSVAASSFDAWIKFYRPDENSVNSAVSYYLKGSLLGLALDLEIRRATSGRKSLDDVARRLLARRRIDEDGVRRAVERVAGRDFGRWFARHVEGTAELDLGRALAHAGVRLAAEPDAGRTGWLGARVEVREGRPVLASVLDGGPAQRSGLSAGDELVALDGLRASRDRLRERLKAIGPGGDLPVVYLREDVIGETSVRLQARRPPLRPSAAPRAGAAARALFEAWLGAPWEELVADGSGGHR